MADIDCENTKNSQEISLCACKNSADTYTNLYKVFLRDKKQYEYDTGSYLRWREAYNRWEVSGGVKPERDPENFDKYWLNTPPPVDNSKVPVYNGICCSLIIDNIKSSGGNVSLQDISQSCGNQALPSNTEPSVPKKETENTIQNNFPGILIEFTFGIVSFCSCSCLFFLIVLVFFSLR